ncbi:MAG TPA: ABC transporter substrate-binding protein [Burkholderiales bacterium]|jgi:putative ABC transport system substrate-binding protein|nr:ABC transporter substrate-binding protein [Burkholderiales bacterium]
MKRREVLTLLAGAAAPWPNIVCAQQPMKSHRVGYLALASGPDIAIVKQRLTELGYSEGRNLVFEVRSAENDATRLASLAEELVRSKPDVLVAGAGTLTAKALQAATNSIPVVFVGVGDPLGAGLVRSLSRPGSNVTGMTPQAAALGGKRLQLLEELTPGIRIVAVLVNPETPFSALALKELQSAARERGLRLEVFEIRAGEQLPGSIQAAVKAGANGLITLEDPLLFGLRRQIAGLVAKATLPTMYGNRQFVEAGGLISYGTDGRQIARRAAELVDKVLRGAKPAEIPVEQATTFELVINLKAAKALGISVPPALMLRADEVIQ